MKRISPRIFGKPTLGGGHSPGTAEELGIGRSCPRHAPVLLRSDKLLNLITITMQSRHIRQSKSCKRCLRRKQRCHGFPICTNCEKANQPCQQSDFALELHRHDDKYTALKRIQTLETQLKNALAELSTVRQQQGQEFVTAGSPTSHFETNSGVPSPVGRGQTSEHEIHRFSSEDTPQCSTMNHDTGDMNIDVRAADAHNVNYNRNSAGGMPTFSPSFSNVDSGFESSKEHTVVEPSSVPTLEHIVQATVWTKVLPPTFNEKVSLSAGSDVPPQIVTPPADEIGRKIIKTYFDKIHPRYPFLYRAEINKLHARRHHTGQPSPAIRFDIFKLNMVYAIGATLLQQTESYADILPESFFMAALQHVSAVRQSPALQCIEAMALLVLYNLRSPCNSGIWHMIGLAMRTCIDLGLQRESSYAKGTTMENQMKRRLFWTIYSLDRIISLSLRRPFSIPDQDIDTNPPSPDDCLIRDAESPIGPLTPNHSLNITGPTLWVRFIQIKRLESRIYSEVYRLDETQQLRFARVKPLLESLDAWTQCFSTLTESDRDYMFLLSSKAVLLLLRPFLTMMRPDDILITRCLKASGQICEAFKRMHQRDSYSHSFVSAHSTFNAGVTIW